MRAQHCLVHRHHLDPWKGGGFGMFSDLPRSQNRVLRVDFQSDQHSIEQFPISELEEGYQSRERKLLVFPTKRRLKSFANELKQREWVIHDDGASTRLMLREKATGQVDDLTPFPLQAVKVHMWEYVFNAEKQQLERQSLLSVTTD
jgi:hypothetical protein